MNTMISLADLFIMLGLVVSIPLIIINSYIIVRSIRIHSMFSFRLSIIAFITAPLIVMPIFFTCFSSYALKRREKHLERLREKKKSAEKKEKVEKNSSTKPIIDTRPDKNTEPGIEERVSALESEVNAIQERRRTKTKKERRRIKQKLAQERKKNTEKQGTNE